MTCPAFGSSSEVAVYYAIDSDPSSAIPIDQAWQAMRIAGEGLDLTLDSTISDEITTQRSYSNSILTSGSSGGTVQFELSYGNFNDFLLAVMQVNHGLNVSQVFASLDTGVIGNDNALSWTSKTSGTGGNSTTVALIASGTSTPLSIAVSGTDIVVNLHDSQQEVVKSFLGL